MRSSILSSARAALASAVVLGALLNTTSCTYTSLAFTPVKDRKPSQYKWLIADAGITAALLVPGLVVEHETVKVALLTSALAWGGLTILLVPLMVMPEPKPDPPQNTVVQGGVLQE
jgi:hypothetical protein